MKNFTVKEISEILNTNPETIRRWIRNGRLHAVQTSKKDGNIISEQALYEFLKITPKYASIATSSISSGLAAIGIGFITDLSTLAVTAIIGKILSEKNKTDKIQITPASMEKYIIDTIADHENNLSEKQKELLKLSAEIENEKKQIDELQISLKKIKMFSTNANKRDI